MRIPARFRDLTLGAAGGLLVAGMLGLASPGDAVPTADRPAESIETGGFEFTFSGAPYPAPQARRTTR